MTRIGTPTNRGLLDSRYLKLTGSLSEVTNHSHTVLTDIGTNTHAQIDTHLAGTLAVHAATTSLQLAGVISDETGSGALMFGTSPTITTSLIMSDGATIGQAAGPLVAFDDTNNYLEITGCNVGIGTTGPLSKLHVVTGTPGSLLFTYDTSTYKTDLTLNFAAGTAASNKLIFNVCDGTTTGQVTALALNGKGYAGIGTNAPIYPLEVVGDAPSPGYFLINVKPSVGATVLASAVGMESRYLSTTQNWFFGAGDGGTPNTNNFRIVDITAGNLDRININTSGNVGIGTKTQGGRLVVKGVGTTTGIGFQTQNSSGTELVTMLDSGNIGIGTTGPSNLLSVVSATGGIVDISRNDTSITAADLIGQLDFRTNDTQTTTNKVAGEIKVSAANTIATDINPVIMDFLVTGTGVAGALIECMSFQATTVAQIGFFGVTPAVQPSHIADPTGGVVVDIEARAAIVSINALLATLGLSASS